MQFVSDLSVTADGFSASYVHRSPHDPPTSHKDPPPDPPKPKNAAKNAKASPPTPPQTQPPPTATPCPQRCRRTGTLQSNFCSSDWGEEMGGGVLEGGGSMGDGGVGGEWLQCLLVGTIETH